MCDYSLHGIPSRLAEKDEVLVVHRFYTGSKGLTSAALLTPTEQSKGFLAMFTQMLGLTDERRVCAVCIPDGAKLVLHGISLKLQQTHGLSSDESITFRQLSMDSYTHRDAVEFSNGVRVRLHDLDEGQIVEVLALSMEDAKVLQGTAMIQADRVNLSALAAARKRRQERWPP
jgi:hypothetical protein